MVNDPGYERKIKAEVVGLVGQCTAGHKIGDTFDISCYNASGMCGFLYHALFRRSRDAYDGAYPWGGDELLPTVLTAITCSR
jgi:uncharacterized repeat protein (TIGR04076 family)